VRHCGGAPGDASPQLHHGRCQWLRRVPARTAGRLRTVRVGLHPGGKRLGCRPGLRPRSALSCAQPGRHSRCTGGPERCCQQLRHRRTCGRRRARLGHVHPGCACRRRLRSHAACARRCHRDRVPRCLAPRHRGGGCRGGGLSLGRPLGPHPALGAGPAHARFARDVLLRRRLCGPGRGREQRQRHRLPRAGAAASQLRRHPARGRAWLH
jgi:hypothetical protein